MWVHISCQKFFLLISVLVLSWKYFCAFVLCIRMYVTMLAFVRLIFPIDWYILLYGTGTDSWKFSLCLHIRMCECLCILNIFLWYGMVRVHDKNCISKSYVYLHVHKWMSCGIKFSIFCQNHSNNFLKNIVQAFFQKKKKKKRDF